MIHFTPPARVWALIAAASVSLLSLTACDRTPTDGPAPGADSMERRDDTNRAPGTTPVEPGNPPAQAVPPLQPEAPPEPGAGGGTGGGTGSQQ
ncbi:MAG: hypothetical protein A2W72_16365 [Burkholderiales bacterium RIFCSPLOWO2_12_67_14]|nr:MAG: hypothetical protein A3I64_06350 [Burkholderiales bacterium RIFCSPLOWO2_02_FULL_67_64]OGB38670.1 MAG: hypothetical protein A2W72_16365 [Burkholderiales bacterium RIFCSPLOWO2_12_67_14]OGB44475.1 MAG: hypothetical protein A3E51_20685 [Burkholderiales bacterium RIFCSPHIGHO2_12_FULL_67_38]OGB81178.1 MAG: hypothetical protein A3G82_20035 [Burkholderiales bacterium RIFCSPLOWO2_12_FULL_67_210]